MKKNGWGLTQEEMVKAMNRNLKKDQFPEVVLRKHLFDIRKENEIKILKARRFGYSINLRDFM